MVTLTVEDFGKTNGHIVEKFTWRTSSGFSVSVISYGAIIQAIRVPDKNGVVKDIALGFDDLMGYIARNMPYFGAAVGRCVNRIAGASFEIDGETYHLAKNLGENTLHGGIVGFDKVIWKPTINGTKVTFSYLSKDGEEGFPGDLVTNISYDVTEDGSLKIQYIALTTARTVVNLTNHSYLNLAGHDGAAEELRKHVVLINADKMTETDEDCIPTGALINVAGTPFDLRAPVELSEAFSKGEKLFHDNFCVSTYGNKGMNFVSRVTHPPSGRTLDVYSDQPGLQFYTANFLPLESESPLYGKDGVGYRSYGAFCLETQNYTDAIHHANFPSAILSPGEVYTHNAIYKFGAEECVAPRSVSA